MMKYIGIICAVAVIGFAGFHFLGNASPDDIKAQALHDEGQGDVVKVDSFKDLIGTGSYRCTVASRIENASSEGVIYISGNQFRGDFKSTIPQIGMTVDTHTIWDGEWIYAWSSLVSQGTKVRSNQSGVTKDIDTVLPQDNNITYECVKAPIDPSLLVLPQDITFEEVSL